jgi:hypothetical protein
MIEDSTGGLRRRLTLALGIETTEHVCLSQGIIGRNAPCPLFTSAWASRIA